MVVPQQIKQRNTIWSSNSNSGYVSKKMESKYANRYLHTHTHSGIIHNSQKVKAAQVSTDKWVGKQNVVHP